MKSTTRRNLLLLGVLVLVVVLVGVTLWVVSRPKAMPAISPSPVPTVLVTPSPGLPSVGPSATATTVPASGFLAIAPEFLAKARADLPAITIMDDLSMDGYSRDQFGPSWTDGCTTTGCGNHCDTRNDILARDLIEETFKSDGCTVLTGILHDPYTGTTIAFVRGTATSGKVQIDHIVPLGDAWRAGGQNLLKADRINLANDPLNLVAVDGPINGAKSDSDAADWLPPQANADCAYVVHQVEVKFTYHLWMSQPEHDAIAGVLAGC